LGLTNDNPFPLVDLDIAESSGCAIARNPDHLDVFWIGRDGAVWSAFWDQNFNNAQWNPPFVLAPAGNAEAVGSRRRQCTGPAVGREANQLDVYWVGPDGSVRSNWWNQFVNNGLWNQPFEVAPPPGCPAAGRRSPPGSAPRHWARSGWRAPRHCYR
jgi:hypothetical protein